LSCLISTHSPCRGDLSSFCLAQSWAKPVDRQSNNTIVKAKVRFMRKSVLRIAMWDKLHVRESSRLIRIRRNHAGGRVTIMSQSSTDCPPSSLLRNFQQCTPLAKRSRKRFRGYLVPFCFSSGLFHDVSQKYRA